MKSVPVIAFLTCLLVICAQGQLAGGSNKCKCLSTYMKGGSSKHIKAEVVHLPSSFCPHTEIIVTTLTDMKKCVNPESPLGKRILKKYKIKHGKN